MEDQTIGKELVLTAPADVAKRSKPTLEKVGNRFISSDGRFHPDLCGDYLLGKARNNWVGVSELSKVFCGAPTIDGKKRVRKSLFRTFTYLLSRGEFLVYETASNGRVNSVKLLNVCSEAERQAAIPQIERMKQRRQLTAEKYEKALKVIQLQQNLLGVEG